MGKTDIKKAGDKNFEMLECARCGVTAPVGFDDEEQEGLYEFILPNEKIPLCCNCIEYMAAKLQEILEDYEMEDEPIEAEDELEVNGISIRLIPAESSGAVPKTKTKTKVKTVKKLMELKELEKEVLKYIIGQDEHVRNIATAIYKGRISSDMKSNILIIGKSGTGKTETIKQIARLLDIPYTIEDASKYTEQGYHGPSVEKMLINLIKNADGDLERASHGMLIIDEIDKKATQREMYERDVSGEGVIKSLLKIIEGSEVVCSPNDYTEYTFDTSNLIVVCMGAFQGLEEIRKKRKKKNRMGFASLDNTSETDLKMAEKNYIKKDFIDFGFTQEFMGRMNYIEEMNNLKVEDLATIIRKSKLSEFQKHVKLLKSLGVRLAYPKDMPEAIAKKSLEFDTGAREISTVINKMFEKIEYEIIACPKKYTVCRITNKTVEDNTKFVLE